MAFTRDWKCPKCGSVSPSVPTTRADQWCPYCGSQMDKIYTPPLVMFKGDGWTPVHYGGKEKVTG